MLQVSTDGEKKTPSQAVGMERETTLVDEDERKRRELGAGDAHQPNPKKHVIETRQSHHRHQSQGIFCPLACTTIINFSESLFSRSDGVKYFLVSAPSR